MLATVLLVLSAAVLAVNAQDCATLPKASPSECCPGFMPSGLTSAVMAECGLPADASPVNPAPCDVSVCILKKANVLTADNKIVDKAAFMAAMDSQYSADFKPTIGPSYDACIGQETKGNCGPYSFIMCLKGQMLKSCPASVASPNPECANTKAFFDKCVSKP